MRKNGRIANKAGSWERLGRAGECLSAGEVGPLIALRFNVRKTPKGFHIVISERRSF